MAKVGGALIELIDQPSSLIKTTQDVDSEITSRKHLKTISKGQLTLCTLGMSIFFNLSPFFLVLTKLFHQIDGRRSLQRSRECNGREFVGIRSRDD